MNIYKDTDIHIMDGLVIISNYKPYQYSEADCNSQYEAYDVLEIK